jgi:Tfp pilus assembly protein PilX
MHLTSTLKDERGIALVMVLIMLVGLTALGALATTTARVETQISGNRVTHAGALYFAEAGVNEAMMRLSDDSSPKYIGENMQSPNTGWGVYIVQQTGGSAEDPDRWRLEADNLDNDIDGLVDESRDYYPEVLSVQCDSLEVSISSTPLDYPYVKVSYSVDSAKTLIRYGDSDRNPMTPYRKNTSEGLPVVKVASLGQKGTARRGIEVELVKIPFPFADGALYIESDSLKFSGQNFRISGQDFDPATGDTIPGSSRRKGIITTKDPDNLLSNLNENQYEQILGESGDADVHGSPYDLDLQGYIDEYSQYADLHYIGDTVYPDTEFWGNMDDYRIIYIEAGDCHVTGNTVGGGLLLVEGDFKASGSFTWYGLVITTGACDFSGGGQETHIMGAIMAGGIAGRSDLAGNADILYSSKALMKLYNLKGFQVLSWREI